MFREGLRPPDPFREVPPLEVARTQDGMSLHALSDLSPVLVVCLPALGTVFCQEMAHDLSAARPAIEGKGTRLVLVHMGTDEEAAARLAVHDLAYVARIADPEGKLYDHFELKRGGVGERLGPRVWKRALKARSKSGGRGKVIGDATRLPGVLLLHNGIVTKSFRAETAADRPDYAAFAGQ